MARKKRTMSKRSGAMKRGDTIEIASRSNPAVIIRLMSWVCQNERRRVYTFCGHTDAPDRRSATKGWENGKS